MFQMVPQRTYDLTFQSCEEIFMWGFQNLQPIKDAN